MAEQGRFAIVLMKQLWIPLCPEYIRAVWQKYIALASPSGQKE